MYVKSFPGVPKQGFVTNRIDSQPGFFARKPEASANSHEKVILTITVESTLTNMLTTCRPLVVA